MANNSVVLEEPLLNEEILDCYNDRPFDIIKCKSECCPKYDSCLEKCDFDWKQHKKEQEQNETLKIMIIVRESCFKSGFLYDMAEKNHMFSLKELANFVKIPEWKIMRLLDYLVSKKSGYSVEKHGEEYLFLED